jgi:hypothetical protein
MSVVARLTAVLGVDSAKFETGMGKASKAMAAFGGAVATGATAATAALGGVVVALGALGVKSAGVIDTQAKLSRSLGVSLKDFQALNLVANEAGVGQEGLTKALTRSTVAVYEAANGAKAQSEAFKALGLDISMLKGLSADKQFEAIGNALARIPDPTQRTALAMQLFGKEGRAIIPMLEEMGGSLDEAKVFQERFNVAVSNIDARIVEEANDSFGRLGMILEGVGNTVAIQFAPLVTDLSQRLIAAAMDGDTFANGLARAMENVYYTIDGVIQVIKSIQIAFREAALGVDAFVLKASYKLEQFAKSAEGIPLIGEGASAAAKAMHDLNVATQLSGKANMQAIDQLKSELTNYESLYDRIQKINTGASTRAKGKETNSFSNGFTLDNEINRATSGLQKLDRAAIDAKSSQIDYNNLLSSSFNDLSQSLINGSLNAKKFKDIALNALAQVAQSMASSLFMGGGGGLGGGGGGGLIGSLLNSVLGGGGGGGGIFSSFLGSLLSFDTGTNYVPNDMVAKIHKGEMIIPAKEAANLRKGGGGNTVNVSMPVTIGDNVSIGARQEIIKALPQLKQMALAVYQDAAMRGRY